MGAVSPWPPCSTDRMRQWARVPFLRPWTLRCLRRKGVRARSGGGLGGSREDLKDTLGAHSIYSAALPYGGGGGGGLAGTTRRVVLRQVVWDPWDSAGGDHGLQRWSSVGRNSSPSLRGPTGAAGEGGGGSTSGPMWRRGSSASKAGRPRIRGGLLRVSSRDCDRRARLLGDPVDLRVPRVLPWTYNGPAVVDALHERASRPGTQELSTPGLGTLRTDSLGVPSGLRVPWGLPFCDRVFAGPSTPRALESC